MVRRKRLRIPVTIQPRVCLQRWRRLFDRALRGFDQALRGEGRRQDSRSLIARPRRGPARTSSSPWVDRSDNDKTRLREKLLEQNLRRHSAPLSEIVVALEGPQLTGAEVSGSRLDERSLLRPHLLSSEEGRVASRQRWCFSMIRRPP